MSSPCVGAHIRKAAFSHDKTKGDGALTVVIIIAQWLGDRLAHDLEPSKMDDGSD
ncbi:MAG: hypothetical protein ABSF13_08265 [Smithella sp.]